MRCVRGVARSNEECPPSGALERLPGVTDSRAERYERRESGAFEMSPQSPHQYHLRSDLTARADLPCNVSLPPDAFEFFREYIGHQQGRSERKGLVDSRAKQPVVVSLDFAGEYRPAERLNLRLRGGAV